MARLTVDDALRKISAKVEEDGTKKLKRFSKNAFDTWMNAAINDVDFVNEVADIEKGEATGTHSVKVTYAFREWLRGIVESFGVDSAESAKILTPEFEIKNVKGLYDFFTAVVYKYMEAGNFFQFPDKVNFRGSIYIKDYPNEVVSEQESKNPRTGEVLGKYSITKKPHSTLMAKSSCPDWCKNREKLK